MTTAAAVQPMKRKGLLRNEKGLTLIELLAVIVILAIIAAIAIPSIGGIINRTKKESHRANAQIIVDAARYAVTAEGFPMVGKKADTNGSFTEGGKPIQTDYFDVTLKELNTKGYLESIPIDPESPDKKTYDEEESIVRIHRVDDSGKYRYQIKLVKDDASHTNVFKPESTEDGYVLESEIKSTPLNGD